MIRDNKIEWARQRLYIPVGHMSLTTVGLSMHSTVPGLVELGTDKEIAALAMTDNDAISHSMEFPSFWDISEEIGVRVLWSAKDAAIGTDAATFIFLYDQVDEDEGFIAPATALDTAIDALDLLGGTTDQMLKRTSRGIINANTFDEAALDGFFSFQVELDATTTFGADEVEMLGVSFDYYPNWCVGTQHSDKLDRIDM